MITTLAPDFAAALPNGGRLAGLDVGTKTIGVALCDAGWSFASPDKTILRKKFSVDLEALKAVIAAQSVVGLVVGLPLNMDGTEGPRCQSVRQFVTNIQNHGAPSLAALPIVFQDERLSTAAVTRGMIDDYDMTRSKRAERVDAAAAAWILESLIARLR